MPRLALAVTLVLLADPAPAAVPKTVPLKDVLAAETYILTATVASIDANGNAAVFERTGDLKGKAPFDRFAVALTGDAEAKRGGHVQILRDRLAPKRKQVLFVSPDGNGFAAFGFVEGTWFQFRGTRDPDGTTVRWAFRHCEPHLRRTFKGTTDELAAAVTDGLAGKRPPPAPDGRAPPGYGPKADPPAGPPPPPPDKKPTAAATVSPALFAVIPSFALAGPLAVLAVLVPTAATALAAAVRRWRAFLAVTGVNSTAATAYFALKQTGRLPEAWWAGPQAVALGSLAVTAVGLAWAGRRYRVFAAADPCVTAPPGRSTLATLFALAATAAAVVVGTGLLAGWAETDRLPGRTSTGVGREFTAAAAGLAAAALYAAYRRLTARADGDPPPAVRLGLSAETAGLAGAFLFGAVTLAAFGPTERTAVPFDGGTGDGGRPGAPVAGGLRLVDCGALYETGDFDEVLSSVAVTPDRLVFGVGRQTGFRSFGAVVCLDRATGREAWRFAGPAAAPLKPVFATPAVAGGRVFAGEGLHSDVDRRLFALDVTTGTPVWPEPVTTTGHTEGTPRVAGDRVYFPAGGDGVYCVAAAGGRVVWHADGSARGLHVDTPPAVAGERVFVGSGYGTRAVFALDAATGDELWRVPVGLRSFGPPLALGDRVVFGLGTGNVTEDVSADPDGGPADREPAGAVVCLRAADGAEVWRADLPRSVHTDLAADATTVYAACRDGRVVALDRATGAVRWARSLGSPLTAGVAAATYVGGRFTLAVYAVSSEGVVAALDTADGRILWTRDLGAQFGREVNVLSTPVVATVDATGARRQVYFGARLTDRAAGADHAALVRIEDAVDGP